MKHLPMLLLCIFLSTVLTGYAQEKIESLTVDLEIRPRFEFRNGFKRIIGEATPAAFIEQRNRLYFHFNNDQFSTQLTLQDIRIWGNVDQIYKSDPTLMNVYEAWGLYKLNDEHQIKVGRQALNYDNARFLGNLDWAQQGRSHDALLYQMNFKESNIKTDIGFTLNQEIAFEPAYLTSNNYTRSNNRTMQFVWFHKTMSTADISLLLHNNGVTTAVSKDIFFMQTFGLVSNFKLSEIQLHSELFYQMGKDVSDKDVSAYLVNLEATFTVSKNNITLGLDWLSGTDKGVTTANNSFNPLYGTNHKFYGFMDYFYVGNPHRQSGAAYDAGLINFYQKVSVPTSEKTALNLDLHQFLSPTEIFDSSDKKISSYLATELDITFVVKPAKSVSMLFGYSHLFETESMYRLKSVSYPASIQNWAWIMLQFKPTILKI